MRQVTTRLQVAWDDDVVELDAERLQGLWTEEQYLRLSAPTSRLVEYVDGRIEVLPAPTDDHQALLKWLLFALVAFVEPRGGVVQFAPLRLRLPSGRFREPDLLLLRDADDPRRQNEYWRGADLVIEVISPDDRDRDMVTKRAEYATAGVQEYWLVDPPAETVTVLVLDGAVYREHGAHPAGETAASALLTGFSVDSAALFAAGRRARA